MRRAAVEPPDGPGPFPGIVRTDGDGPDIPIGELQDVVFNVTEAAEDLSRGGSSTELGPVLASLQARIQTPVRYTPVADDEIEVGRRNGLKSALHGPYRVRVCRWQY